MQTIGPAALDRRAFLKLGMTGTLLLGAGGLGATLAGCGGKTVPPAAGMGFLREADVALFRALAPVVLEGAPLTPAIIDECLLRIDAACVWLQPAAQGEARKLFDLLNTGLLRRLTTGLAHDWSDASADELRAFLDRWRNSSVGLFNAGYRGLVKLLSVGYYSQRASWAVSGYPGPLKAVYEAVNAGAGA